MKIDFSALRERMVREQIEARGINNPRVLAALRKVPRHKFVPEKYVDSAYEDSPLPIGAGQTISQPYMVALMSECLELCGGETVLEVGTGSGYQTAVLAELAGSVYSLERVEALAGKARETLKRLGYQNVRIVVADGTCGWEEFAPYEGIIVTAAAPAVPQALLEQLNSEGKLIIPVGKSFNQILTVVSKHRGKIQTKEISGCVFVPLVGKYGWPR